MTDQGPLGPPPIEPLSDVAWARVERDLWSRMDSGGLPVQATEPARRRWLWIAAPMLVAAAVIVVVVTRPSPPPIETVEPGSDVADVRVVAPENAPASASFNDAYIELEPRAVVVMRHDHPTTVLERGAATFAVAPRAERPPFVVVAGDTTVRVIGTRFRVARTDERVAVEVDHGLVEVQFRGEQVKVAAHQRWTSDHPHDIAPIQTAARTEKVDPVTKPVIEPEIEIAPPVAPRVTKKTESDADRAKPVVDADRAKFERLTALETKDAKAAMAGYLELSQANGRWAANALYAAGRLAADRHDPRARSLLAVYLKRFPTGANTGDARDLLSRLP